MKKKLSDHTNIGLDRNSGQKNTRTIKSGSKRSNVSKKIANIHRQ